MAMGCRRCAAAFLNEVTQVGLETVAATFAYGASGVRFLTRAKPRTMSARKKNSTKQSPADRFLRTGFG